MKIVHCRSINLEWLATVRCLYLSRSLPFTHSLLGQLLSFTDQLFQGQPCGSLRWNPPPMIESSELNLSHNTCISLCLYTYCVCVYLYTNLILSSLMQWYLRVCRWWVWPAKLTGAPMWAELGAEIQHNNSSSSNNNRQRVSPCNLVAIMDMPHWYHRT